MLLQKDEVNEGGEEGEGAHCFGSGEKSGAEEKRWESGAFISPISQHSGEREWKGGFW